MSFVLIDHYQIDYKLFLMHHFEVGVFNISSASSHVIVYDGHSYRSLASAKPIVRR